MYCSNKECTPLGPVLVTVKLKRSLVPDYTTGVCPECKAKWDIEVLTEDHKEVRLGDLCPKCKVQLQPRKRVHLKCPKCGRIYMSTRAEPIVSYSIDFKFTDGKVRMALREDEEGMKILSMRSYPQRKGLGRKALHLLKEKDIVGRPVNIRHKADKFWVKMRSEGLVK